MDLLAALQAADYAKAQPLIEKVLRYEPSNELMLEYRVVVQRALKRADDHTEDDADDDSASVASDSSASSTSSSASTASSSDADAEEEATRHAGGAAGGPGRGRVAGHGRRAARERGLHPARRGEEATTKSQGRRARLLRM